LRDAPRGDQSQKLQMKGLTLPPKLHYQQIDIWPRSKNARRRQFGCQVGREIMTSRNKLRLTASLLAAQFALTAATAWAQSPARPGDEAKEEIVVTGTSLRGAPPVGGRCVRV
jgi:hypothetical protein